MKAILAVKNTFDAMVVDNSHKYLSSSKSAIERPNCTTD